MTVHNSERVSSLDRPGYSASHVGKGKDYEDNFDLRPGRRAMWHLERNVLASILRNQRYGRYLDFACGTGRVLEELASYAEETFGVDISDSMLKVARSKFPAAQYLVADIRNGLPQLQERQFDLITAFRFFPNAEPQLRESAMNVLSSLLGPDGLLIVNNHRNLGSLPFRALRLLGKPSARIGMTDDEMHELAERHNLDVRECYSLGIVPQSERRSILPWGVTELVERSFANAFATHQKWGYNLLYVLERRA
jgi:SAM-dependent methyltransferase